MHQVRFIYVDGLPVMEQRDEDSQPHGSLGGGDGHHEKDEDESVELVELPGVGDEGQIHGVYHQLDGHEDGDSVPAGQHAADAEREEDGAEDQEPVRRDHRASGAAPADDSAPAAGRWPPGSRALSNSAPTIAASSRIDTASNGKM